MRTVERLPVVVLISGQGSNLQAMIDAAQSGRLPVEIRAVISNRERAFGLERARRANIPAHCILAREFDDSEHYERALVDAIDRFDPGLVVLAGFMRVLSAGFVRHYHGRIMNIHPSLLPKYRGLHTHRRVLEAGDETHGATVHFVTEELDGGPAIVQADIPVEKGDDEQSLATKVQALEHVIYPQAMRLFAEGRVRMTSLGVELDGHALQEPLPPDAVTSARLGGQPENSSCD